MPKIRSFLIALILFTLPLMLIVAQELPQRPTIIRNYLTNGEFEAPYDDLGGVLSREVAEGWTPWSLASEAEYPIFEPASLNSPDRILQGEDAQKFVAFLYTELNAGVYQSVIDLEARLDYTFSINAYIWSSNDETEREVSADPCGTTIEVGIDPTGGIDPNSEAIVWSEPVETCDEYTEHAVTTLVEADTATVFVRAAALEVRVLTEVYLDEAMLLQADAEEAAAQRGTEEPAGTEAADATDEVRPGGDAGIITPPGTEAAVITEEPTPELSLTEEVPATMELQPTAEIFPTDEIALPTEDPGIALTLDAEILGTNSALSATTQADLAAQTAAFDLAATGIILTTTQQAIDAQNTAAAVTNQAGVDADATALIGTSTQIQIQAEMDSTATAIQSTNAAVALQATEIIAQATNIISTVTAQAQLTAGAPTQTAAVIVITATIEPATDVPPTMVVLPTNTPSPEPIIAEPTAAEADVIDATEEAVGSGEDARVIPLSEQFPGRILHTVQNGETVSYLSTLYGSTNEAIIAANGLNENALIYVGQGLLIPVRVPPLPTITPTPAVTNAPTQTVATDVYLVQVGDTLSQIARRYNTTVTTLAQLNGITNINSIRVGQRLQLPGGGAVPSTPNAPTPVPPQTTYMVQPGDSLYIIAIRYRVTIAQLLEANQIENPNRIFVGQRLEIPQVQ